MDISLGKRAYSGTALKRLACVCMLLDHIGASCIESGAFRLAPPASALVVLDVALRAIGRLAFPIYCFLLVEGFEHTRSVRGYVLRLLAFALLSEVPFDMAFYDMPLYWHYQNVYWTLTLGVIAMALMRRFDGGDTLTWRGALSAAVCAALAEALRADYGAAGVLLVVVLYTLRADRKRQCIAGAALTLYEFTAPLAFLPILLYSGERGRCGKAEKWLYYCFYPAHLAVLAAVTDILVLR